MFSGIFAFVLCVLCYYIYIENEYSYVVDFNFTFLFLN